MSKELSFELSLRTSLESGRSDSHSRPFFFLSAAQIPILAIGTVLAIATGLAPVALTIVLGQVFNVLADLSKFSSKHEYLHAVLQKTSLFLAVGAAGLALNWALFFCWMRIGELQASSLRRKVFHSYLQRPLAWYDQNQNLTGELTQLHRCIEDFRAGSSEALVLTIQSIVTLVAAVCVSFYYLYKLSFVTLALFPFIVVYTLFLSQKIQKCQVEENKASEEAADIVDWLLSAYRLMKLSLTQQREINRFLLASKTCSAHFLRGILIHASQNGVTRVLVLMLFVQAFWYGTHLIRQGLRPGLVLVCLSACVVFALAFSALSQHVVFLLKARASTLKLHRFLKSSPKEADHLPYPPDLLRSHNLSLVNISFAYPLRPDTCVLDNLNVQFPSNKLSFVVGSSGSGKSTLGSLVSGLYEPLAGEILFNGASIRTKPQSWLANNVTYLLQTPTLFDALILENIAMAIPGFETVTEAERQTVNRVLDAAVLRDLVNSLPHREDTKISFDGRSLSGGQQQRVALARALIRDTPILILDEAFSALDGPTKALAMENTRKWRENKTTVVITHDLDTINDLDMVYVMMNGKVVQGGLKRDLSLDFNSPFQRLLHESKEQSTEDLLDTIFDYYESQNEYSMQRFSLVLLAENNMSLLDLDIGSYNTHRSRRKLALCPDLEAQLPDETLEMLLIAQVVGFVRQTCSSLPILGLGIAASAAGGALTPLFSFFIAKVIAGLVPHGSIGTPSYNLRWSLVVVGVIIIDGGLTFAREALLGHVAETWIRKLRVAVFAKLAAQDALWHDKYQNRYAELSALLMNDSRDLRTFVQTFFLMACSVVVILAMGIIWAIVVGWKIALVGLGLGVMFAIITIFYSALLLVREKNYKSRVAEVENLEYEAVCGVRTLKSLNLSLVFSRRFDLTLKKVEYEGTLRALSTGLGVALGMFLSCVAQMVLLYYGLKLVGEKEYSPQQLMTVYLLLIFSIMSVVLAMAQFPELGRGQRAASYLRTLYLMQDSISESQGDLYLNQNQGYRPLVSIQGLSFDYDSKPVLRNLNLQIQNGEVLALTGPSGCGKSTVAALLTRFYSAPRNTIRIEGKDITQLNVLELRRYVAVVPQKAVFFKGLIYENLIYGLGPEEYSPTDIVKALEQVGLLDFVLKLSDGLKTIIGGQAADSLLSGGQAQRLSVARALLRNPRILIMDECTSALDPQSTRLMCDLIERCLVKGEREITMLLITHSPEVMRVASRVVYMENGRVI